MRIGILGVLHESNTFSAQPTTLNNFQQDLWLEGDAIPQQLAAAHHEVGGFFQGLKPYAGDVQAVPLMVTRATPSGPISAAAFDEISHRLERCVLDQGPWDGLLVAFHGAAVSQEHPDADGVWMTQLRELVGPDVTIVSTLDLHGNLSAAMVSACNAMVGYRTNPHLDQRQRGAEAARLIVRSLQGEVTLTMAAAFPRLAINIEKQCTDEPFLRPAYDLANRQLQQPGVLSNTLMLGFPYADVAEMGAATMVVTDDDPPRAQRLADDLADQLWHDRQALQGQLTTIAEAIRRCQQRPPSETIGLLDMGDNVGGGSSADGTTLIAALHEAELGPCFACLFDPESVGECVTAGPGARLTLAVGGKTDTLHGAPIQLEVTVRSLHDGRFRETQPRHGGIVQFDQGKTAIVQTSSQLTLMLTSRRMVPFSLQQLISCDIHPKSFRVLVAKGVNAPIAAYRDVCETMIRVNTIGSTCADMQQLTYVHRRKPLFPFE